MTYILADSSGYVDDVASVSGYDDLYQFVKKQTGIPYLKTFMDNGETQNQDAVIDDIKLILPKVTDITVRKTLTKLMDNLAKTDEVAIISQ